jgi:hypothetical protein
MQMADWYTKNVERYYGGDVKKLQGIMYKNALEIFPRVRKYANAD